MSQRQSLVVVVPCSLALLMARLPELIEFWQQLLVDALTTLTAYVSGRLNREPKRVSKPPTATPIKVR